jgi:purine-nucleoside phosphorylase
MGTYDAVLEAAAFIRTRAPLTPRVGIILGSGLGEFAARVEDAVDLAYSAIPHWPRAAVVGHPGRLVVGRLARQTVAVLAGRAHYYEGVPLAQVTFPVRVLGQLGVSTLIVTNAAGGIDPTFEPGTLMVIDDHLNLMGTNPLIGPNDERFGPRFPDMTEAYSRRLRQVADEAAQALGLPIRHGVYAAVAGPSYETPAEIRALRALGADAVGMSTVPEVIVARHMGLEVLGLSCITNPAAGVRPRPLAHEEVLEVAARVGAQVGALLVGIIDRL